jgi:hypothetical protein
LKKVVAAVAESPRKFVTVKLSVKLKEGNTEGEEAKSKFGMMKYPAARVAIKD